MWRSLFARWRSRRPTSEPVRQFPIPEPALLLPGSGGRPFPALSAILEACADAARRPDVLLFGDSVMERVSRHDVDRRDLGALVTAALSPLSVQTLSHSAFNPAIYEALARVVARCPYRPHLIVVPVNLRCFSPQWDLHPARQFTREIAFVDAWLADPTQPVPVMQDIRDSAGFLAQYDAQIVEYPLSPLNTVGAFRARVREVPVDDFARDARARDIFVFHYTHPLVATHRRLVALRQTLATLAQAGCGSLVYVTPVNHQAGMRLVSDAFMASLRRNVAVLRAALGEYGPSVFDWSELLPADRFFHEDLATEHLNETGRAEVASRIADVVRSANA